MSGSLEKILAEEKPNIIVITGDLIDSRRPNFQLAYNFVKAAANIAPTYYVTGNHENRFKNYSEIMTQLEALGAIVLENKTTFINKNEDELLLLGLRDTSVNRVLNEKEIQEERNRIGKDLSTLVKDYKCYKILLSHRPDLFPAYDQKNSGNKSCRH